MSLKIDKTPDTEQLSEETRHQLFTRLKPEDIEQFYMAYQLWSQQQQIKRLQLHMLALNQKISDNKIDMEQFQPSAIALATLAQLQAYGVEDIDLLDRMLERGDEWLDQSLQLLERCEQLDLIGGNYTQWCEHAMEGAYEWMNSIADSGTSEIQLQASSKYESTIEAENAVTEAQLLRKLMDEETEEIAQIAAPQKKPRITQPLTMRDEQENTEDDTKKREIIQPTKRPHITQPFATTDVQDSMLNKTPQVATIEPIKSPYITKPLATTNEQTETSSPPQTTTKKNQDDSASSNTMNNTEMNLELPINNEHITIIDHTHTNLDPNSLSQPDAISDRTVLPINSKREDAPQQLEVIETGEPAKNAMEAEEKHIPINAPSTIVDTTSIEEKTTTVTPDSEEMLHSSQNDEKDICASQVVNKEENEIQPAKQTENSYEAASIAPDSEKETAHSDNEMVTAEQIDRDNSENGPTHLSAAGEQLNRQLKDLPLPKKGRQKKKRGFFRWLLAKIMRN